MFRAALAFSVLVPLAAFGGAAVRSVQPQQAKADPLVELLAEVRELRVAMERLASAAPRMQLLTSRLTIQEERVNRTARDLESLRSQIDSTRTMAQALRAQAKRIDEGLSDATDPRERGDLERRKQEMNAELEALGAREQALRGREADALGALGLEQARWEELSGRLDDLERVLDGRR